MTDTEKLKSAIKSKGLKIGWIAEQLGTSYAGLYLKVTNKREFRASEISKLKNLLSLSNAQVNEIFFAQNVE